MSNSQTLVKLCFQVEPFDADAYPFLVHSSAQINYVKLTSNSTLNDVSLLIGSLLDFNELSLNSKFVDALYKEEELALVGGLLFEQNGLKIGASCCADFQEWEIVAEEIKSGISPWIGHDPSPWFEFKGKNIIVWSEDDRENSYSIQLTQTEFSEQLEIAKQELQGFLEIVKAWALENYKVDYKRLVKGINHYLFVKY